ncbi:MAG: type II toxin-antitoxin system VapC family toxin [Bryobacterales bacterium]|nr:type II toxin-antitoxin system VapC family toxin [Bryobacterales bacterium]
MILLDTNVLSEAVRPVPSEPVLQWLTAQSRGAVYISSVTVAELLLGVEMLAPGRRRTRLLAVIENLLAAEFQGRILPFDESAARLFPKIVAEREAMGRPISQFDAIIASVCRSRNAVLATRNVRDFEHCGIRFVNPWDR